MCPSGRAVASGCLTSTRPADGVQGRGPGSVASLQSGDERVRSAGDHPVLVHTLLVGVTERAVRRARGIRPQLRTDVLGQDQTAVRDLRRRYPGQGPPQPRHIKTTPVGTAVESPVTTTVFGSEREIDQRPPGSSLHSSASVSSDRVSARPAIDAYSSPSGSVTASRTPRTPARHSADSSARPPPDSRELFGRSNE